MRQTKLLKAAKLVDRSIPTSYAFYAAMASVGVSDAKITAAQRIVPPFMDHPATAERDVRVLALLFLNEMSLRGDLA
jgi:hypothetical protein